MDFSLFTLPVGIVFLLVVVVVVYSHFRTTTAAITSKQRVQSALLAAGKKSARKPIALLLDVRRKAEYYEPLLYHLAEHGSTVELIAVVYHTAGPRAAAGIRRYARKLQIRSSVLNYKKDRTLTSTIQRARAPYIMRITADDRLSNRFSEYVSLAFATGIDALSVPRLFQPGRTLASAWNSLTSIIRQSSPHKPVVMASGTLPHDVLMRRQTVRATRDVYVHRLLTETFAITSRAGDMVGRIRSSWVPVVGAAGALLLVAAIVTTPFEILIFLAVLLGSVLWMSAIGTIVNVTAIALPYKIALILLVPFYPLYVLIVGVRSLLQK
jgi:hypothetical protein